MLLGEGALSDGSNNMAFLLEAAPSATSVLFLGFSSTPVPFKGGTLMVFPFAAMIPVVTSTAGTVLLPFTMPPGVPAGSELWMQYAIQDAGAVFGVALSNALVGTTS